MVARLLPVIIFVVRFELSGYHSSQQTKRQLAMSARVKHFSLPKSSKWDHTAESSRFYFLLNCCDHVASAD